MLTRKIFILLIFTNFIFSCSSNVKSQWDCPAIPGKFCNTISEADKEEDQEIDSKLLQERKIIDEDFKELFVDDNKDNKANISKKNLPMPFSRSGENLARLWFSPFVDNEGNLHDEHIIYVVVRPNEWLVK